MGGSATYRAKKKVASLTSAYKRARSPQKRAQLDRDLRAAQKKAKTLSREKMASKAYSGGRMSRAERQAYNRSTAKGFSNRLYRAAQSAKNRGIRL